MAQRKKTQTALNSYLMAAGALAQTNQLVEAEIRYKDSLRRAEKDYGKNSDQVMLVTSILASFYRAHDREDEAREIEARLFTWQMDETVTEQESMQTRFIQSQGKNGNSSSEDHGIRVPAVLRKSCQLLGLPIDEPLTASAINKAWKKQMLSNGAHPDLGGNTDEAVLLNKAKEELLHFLDERAPKLGAKLKSK